jgi:prepilin-type N-terminal cleavage/methylation domain-containing protein
MRTRTKQSGFSVVELLIVVAVVAVLGFAGYSVYSRQQKADNSVASQASSQSDKADDVASAPNVSSTSDLDKAAATLDQTDPGGSNNSDASQLDSQLANF